MNEGISLGLGGGFSVLARALICLHSTLMAFVHGTWKASNH